MAVDAAQESIARTCEGLIRTELAGKVEPWLVAFESCHRQPTSPGQPRYGHAQQTDGAGTQHEDARAWLDVRMADDRIVCDAAGLGKGGHLKGHAVWKMMQATRRYAYELRHSAVYPVAETEAFRAQVVLSGAAVCAFAADASGRFRHHTIPFAKAAHASPYLSHNTAELVS